MNKVMKLSEIKIKKSFLERPPHEEKLAECKNNYLTQDKPNKKIIVNYKGYLIDGYCLYLVMKELNVKETLVKISKYPRRKREIAAYRNQHTTYIFGYHPKAKEHTEFCWRVPNAQTEWICSQVNVGDTVLCQTKFGIAPVIVTRMETLDKCSVDMRVKKFIRKVDTKRIYMSAEGTPESDEANEHLLKIRNSLIEAKQTMTSEDYERFFVNCHDAIRKANNFPNQIFTIVCNRNEDKAWFVFFDYEPDGNTHNVYLDKERKSLYITVKC